MEWEMKARKVPGLALTPGLCRFSVCPAGFSRFSCFHLQFKNMNIRLMETLNCLSVCGCVSEWCVWTVHVYSFYKHTRSMFRHWFCKTGIPDFVLAKVPLCGRPQNVYLLCIYVGSAKRDNVSQFHDIQCSSPVYGCLFFVFFVVSAPNPHPAQAPISVIVFFTLTRKCKEALCSDLLHCCDSDLISDCSRWFFFFFPLHQSFLL